MENQDRNITVEEGSVHGPDKKLKPYAKMALIEFRLRLEKSIQANDLFDNMHITRKIDKCHSKADLREDVIDKRDISLWGVPLLPSEDHEGTDVILLKFLRARDFKVLEAFELLQKTLIWRREFGTDGIVEEDFGRDLKNVAFLDGSDKQGQPLSYIVYGAFKDKDLYQSMFGCVDNNSDKFVRWRVQCIERGIENLNLKDGGINSIVHITDLKDLYKYVPFWYYAYHALSSRMLTQRMKNKFIFARPSKVAKTLLKYIAPEYIPVQYGGLKRESDQEFTPSDQVSDATVEGGIIETIKFPISEPGVTIVWDITVVGWDVTYQEEFIPDDEGSYKIVIQSERKMSATVRSSYYINEPGKIQLIITNNTFKKKKILYRSKFKPTIPMYVKIR
ncbi:hypothetical protein MKW98_000739 [Papaver atlanticum]|uniref:Patellin-4 n=1 Tax=Papaver atlanticum TaxID=357466 RepID=A0AAD4XCE4_9MAGN|nr:hypothetical protein MKW98_000739 [Papaver atlanticum]